MKFEDGPIAIMSAINRENDFLFSKLLECLNITKMETIYLRTIASNPGITQYKIATEKRIDKSLVTKYISILETKNFIEKKQLDKRRKGLYLTKTGEKVLVEIKNFTPDLQAQFKDLFTEEEKEIFLKLLIKLKNKLEEINERDYFYSKKY